MASKGDIRAAIDNSRLTTRLSIIGGITSLILLVLTLVLGAVKGELVGADVFSLAVIPYSLALLFSISALIYGMLGTGAAIENEEKMLLAGRASTNALNVEEDVRFTAGRSFENYRRFAPYVLSVLAALLVAGLLGYFFRHWAGRPARRDADRSGRGDEVGAFLRNPDARECICGGVFRRGSPAGRRSAGCVRSGRGW